jgi:pyrroline-5-carboxylate reductase
MIKVVLLGFGNVNSHLLNALDKSDKVSVIQVFNRNYIKMISPFTDIPFTDDISKIANADIYIIGIPDDAISSFSESLPFQNKFVVHTSGGAAMSVLSAKKPTRNILSVTNIFETALCRFHKHSYLY